jgi:hypothetical protein
MTEIKTNMVNMDDAVARLDALAGNIKTGIKKGITKATTETMRAVSDYLSGPKGSPGDYPVPVVTGHLRGRLDFVPPGQSKRSDGLTFNAKEFEGVVFNSARYADVIKDGTHSSGKYGPRDYMGDGVDAFGGSARVVDYLLREIQAIEG